MGELYSQTCNGEELAMNWRYRNQCCSIACVQPSPARFFFFFLRGGEGCTQGIARLMCGGARVVRYYLLNVVVVVVFFFLFTPFDDHIIDNIK